MVRKLFIVLIGIAGMFFGLLVSIPILLLSKNYNLQNITNFGSNNTLNESIALNQLETDQKFDIEDINVIYNYSTTTNPEYYDFEKGSSKVAPISLTPSTKNSVLEGTEKANNTNEVKCINGTKQGFGDKQEICEYGEWNDALNASDFYDGADYDKEKDEGHAEKDEGRKEKGSREHDAEKDDDDAENGRVERINREQDDNKKIKN